MFWQNDSKPVMKGKKFTHRDRMARVSSFVLIGFIEDVGNPQIVLFSSTVRVSSDALSAGRISDVT
jgi:hypothetical protein